MLGLQLFAGALRLPLSIRLSSGREKTLLPEWALLRRGERLLVKAVARQASACGDVAWRQVRVGKENRWGYLEL